MGLRATKEDEDELWGGMASCGRLAIGLPTLWRSATTRVFNGAVGRLANQETIHSTGDRPRPHLNCADGLASSPRPSRGCAAVIHARR